MTFGQKLKYLRTHYTEYTQEEVADLLDIPRQTYGRYESDYRNPKHVYAQKQTVILFAGSLSKFKYEKE